MKRAILAVLIVLACARLTEAQTVFLVRHAERADAAGGGATMMAQDPELSPVGRSRAEALASALKDAGVTAIFTSQYKRTRQTAEPLAKLLGITVETVPSKDPAALAGRIRSARGNVLVVGHSDTIPEIVKTLGVASAVSIGEGDYDNLFVVTLGDRPALVRLHY